MEFAETIRAAWNADREDRVLQRGVQGWMKKLLCIFAPAFDGMRRNRKSRTLIVEERISLGPKKMLMLISCRGQSFLVASGAEEVSAVLPLRPARRQTSQLTSAIPARSRRSRK